MRGRTGHISEESWRRHCVGAGGLSRLPHAVPWVGWGHINTQMGRGLGGTEAGNPEVSPAAGALTWGVWVGAVVVSEGKGGLAAGTPWCGREAWVCKATGMICLTSGSRP